MEIYNIVAKLKNTNSTGIDGIPSKVVKSCLQYIIEPLKLLINQTFETGQFPDCLKTAVIKPVFKKGCKLNCDNYRSIALLSTFSKILEKCFANRLHNFLEKFKILSNNQYGFRKNVSTTDAIVKFVDLIYKCIDEDANIVAIFADLSKAFDCVDHDLLLKKLNYLGIRGNALLWIASYLKNRQQLVQINNKQSKLKTNKFSVPQGSVLGPILYILYVNDFPDIIKTGLTTIFADDTNCLQFDLILDNVILKTNNSLKNMQNWFSDHNLIMNTEKTVILPLNVTPNDTNKIENSLNFPIDTVDYAKFLGVTIDLKLNWRQHIDDISPKIARACFCLKKIKTSTSINICKIYYFANIHSLLTYGIICWGVSKYSERIFKLQKSAVRTICNVKWDTHCKPLFKENNILTLPCIYIYETLIHLFKNISDYQHLGGSHDYQTRHGDKILSVPRHRLKFFESSPHYMGIKLYNKLPRHIQQNKNIKHFKYELKKYLTGKCFYSIEEFLCN